MDSPVLLTVGFTQKSAEEFFTRLRSAGVVKLLDVRLNNVSQLAGFTKKDDLRFFLKELCACEYEHRAEWAPTKDILDDYKKKRIDWPEFEVRFNALLRSRQIELGVSPSDLDRSCLLCSEASADKCHRRLIAEYLKRHVGSLRIVHL